MRASIPIVPDRQISAPALSRKKNDVMRLVDVSYAADVSADGLHIVAQFLPDLIAEAVDGSEQPWAGPASVRDIEI